MLAIDWEIEKANAKEMQSIVWEKSKFESDQETSHVTNLHIL